MKNGSYHPGDVALLLVLAAGCSGALSSPPSPSADPSDAGTCAPWGPDAAPPHAPPGCQAWYRCEGDDTPGPSCSHDGYQPGAEPAVTWWCCP